MHRTLFAILFSTAGLYGQVGSTTGASGAVPIVPSAFSTYGTGCAGSGWNFGNNIVVPASAAAAFSNANNNIPFSWDPCRYQQVYLGTEIAFAGILAGIGMRQDDQFNGFDGQVIEIEMWLGGTSFDHTTLTNTYANNFNSTAVPQRLVFTRRKFALPKMPPTNPTNPADFFITIPFDIPFPLALPTGENLVVEVINWGNSNNNAIFTYPLDAGNNITTTRLYAIAPGGGPMSPTGTLGRNYGHVMALKPIGGQPPVPTIYNSNLPRMGSNFHLGLGGAKTSTAALLFVGRSNSSFFGIPLPFSMAALGAPGCTLLASAQLLVVLATAGGGDLAFTLPIPSDRALDGANVYFQYVLVDTGVNPLGIVTSNGGTATIGT
jgi:hypothetical protein